MSPVHNGELEVNMKSSQVTAVILQSTSVQRPDMLKNLAYELLETYDASTSAIVFEEAIGTYEETYERGAESLSDFGDTLYYFCLAHGIEETHSSCYIELLLEGLRPRLHGYPLHDQSLNLLARSFLDMRYLQSDCCETLLECASPSRVAFGIRIPGHIERFKSMNNFAIDLARMTEHTSDMGIQAQIVSFHRKAVRVCSRKDPMHHITVNNFGDALYNNLGISGGFDIPAEVIVVEVMQLLAKRHPQRFAVLRALTNDLMLYSICEESPYLLLDVIDLKCEATELEPHSDSDRARIMSNFTDALLRRFRPWEAHKAFIRAIGLLHDAVIMQLPAFCARRSALDYLLETLDVKFENESRLIQPGHLERLKSRNNSAKDHTRLLARISDVDIQAEMVGMHLEILRMCPCGQHLREIPLNNLGTPVYIRFELLGDFGISSEVTGILKEAIQLWIVDTYRRFIVLKPHGNVLTPRFVWEGYATLLSEVHREALQLLPDNHFHRVMRLCNLSQFLLFSFRESREVKTLAESIRLVSGCEAPYLAPSILAAALELNHDTDSDPEALSVTTNSHRENLALRPFGWWRWLRSLGRLVRVRCKSESCSWSELIAWYQKTLRAWLRRYLVQAPPLSGIDMCFLDSSRLFLSPNEGKYCLSEADADSLSHVGGRLDSVIHDLQQWETAIAASTGGVYAESHAWADAPVVDLDAQVFGLQSPTADNGLNHIGRLQSVRVRDEIVQHVSAIARLLGLDTQVVGMVTQRCCLSRTQTLHPRANTFNGVLEDEYQLLQKMIRFLNESPLRVPNYREPSDQRDRVLEKLPQLNSGIECLSASDESFASLQHGFAAIMNFPKLCHRLLLGTGIATSLALKSFCIRFACAKMKSQLPRHIISALEEKDKSTTRSMHVSSDTSQSIENSLATVPTSPVQLTLDARRLEKTQGCATLRSWWCLTGKLCLLPMHAVRSHHDADLTCVADCVVLLSFPTMAARNQARDIWNDRPGCLIYELSSLNTALLAMSSVQGRDHEVSTVNSCKARVHLRPNGFDDTSLGRPPTCLTSHHSDQRAGFLKHFADKLLAVYHTSHLKAALEKAISIHEEALRLQHEGHECQAETLTHLGDTLYCFCCDQGVEEARGKFSTECHRQALHVGPPGNSLRDESLHNLLRSQRAIGHERLDDLNIPIECVSHNREDLQHFLLGHLERSYSMDSLNDRLHMIVDHANNMKILTKVISSRREVLLMRPLGHPLRSVSLHVVATGLCTSFEHLDGPEILVETISTLRQATQHSVGQSQRCMLLDTRGRHLSLGSFYEQHSVSFWEPIALDLGALRLLPLNHPTQARLGCKITRALLVIVCDREDGNAPAEAASLLCEVVIMSSPSFVSPVPDIARKMLAEAKFDMRCDTEALSEATIFGRATLQRYSLGHVSRFCALCKARAFFWPEALTCCKEVLQLCSLGYLKRAQVLSGMKKCFLDPSRPLFSPSQGMTRRSEAYLDISSYVNESLKSAMFALHRLEVTYDASIEGAQAGSHGKLDEGFSALYAQVIRFLPQVVSFKIDHSARLQAVTAYDEIARDAAARAVLSGCLPQAVAMLEHGRGRFWTQALYLRTATFDGVFEDDCHKLQRILRVLERGPPRSESPEQTSEERERELEKRSQLNQAVRGLILNIRGYLTFDRFLLPPSFDALLASLPDGFVVIVNTSKLGDHALLLQRETGLATSLALQTVRTGFDSATLQAHIPRVRSSGHRAMRVNRGRGRRFQDVLASLWISIVKPILDVLGMKKTLGRARPRLWWCVTGQLGFSPIHAAGRYHDKSPVCVSDYVVSSYIPTLASLTKARRFRAPIARSDLAGILVCEASTAGEGSTSYLSGAVDEVDAVGACFASAGAQVLNKPGAHTSVSELRSFLNDTSANILHLACHGVQHSDPLKSSFLLCDAEFAIEDIMELNLPHACLAFLNACETAKGDRNAPDQAVHLAASMLFCGFRSVVGTMWSMCDADGPSVARCFYESLFKREQVGLDDIAYALDDAVQALRHLNVPASRWAPFVHIGG